MTQKVLAIKGADTKRKKPGVVFDAKTGDSPGVLQLIGNRDDEIRKTQLNICGGDNTKEQAKELMEMLGILPGAPLYSDKQSWRGRKMNGPMTPERQAEATRKRQETLARKRAERGAKTEIT